MAVTRDSTDIGSKFCCMLGVGIGGGIMMYLHAIVWCIGLVVPLVVGLRPTKFSIIETGPTGALAPERIGGE